MAIGLFGLAVGTLSLGVAQLGGIPESNKVGTLVIALASGGILQLLADITDIRYHEELGGTALTVYGFFWTTVCTAKLVSEGTSFHLDMVLFAPINIVYCLFSAVMVYLTAYRNAALCLLHIAITVTFFTTSLARLNLLSEILPGIGHLVVGLMAFYHTVESLSQACTGSALLHHRHETDALTGNQRDVGFLRRQPRFPREALLTEGLDLALEWGEHFLQPIQGGLAARQSHWD